VTSIQPELRVDRGAEAVAFYQAAFGATVLHRVGDGEDIVAQLAIGDAAFWVSTAGSAGQRIHPKAIGGATSRTLLIVDDPEAVFHHAVTAGATPTAPWQTHTAGGLPGSQTHSAINGKSGAPSAPGRHPHPHPNHHRQLAYASAGSRSQRVQITRFSAHHRWRRERLHRRADRRIRYVKLARPVTERDTAVLEYETPGSSWVPQLIGFLVCVLG
jgi:PhnB protein